MGLNGYFSLILMKQSLPPQGWMPSIPFMWSMANQFREGVCAQECHGNSHGPSYFCGTFYCWRSRRQREKRSAHRVGSWSPCASGKYMLLQLPLHRSWSGQLQPAGHLELEGLLMKGKAFQKLMWMVVGSELSHKHTSHQILHMVMIHIKTLVLFCSLRYDQSPLRRSGSPGLHAVFTLGSCHVTRTD